ncbi:MAG TPA: hypothetical protein VGV93_03815 [Acidimicrobiales bacterium]|nr:hypothetical protein [Acidimicrobiales bacterium]
MVLTRARARRWPTALVGLAVAIVLGAGILAALVNEPRFPDEWDPRVAGLADYVAGERGLAFEHPVHVDFLSEEDFRRTVTSEDAQLTVEDRAELEQGAAFLRATGLASGDVDLLNSANELSGEATLAYYDPAVERVTVRGTELSVGVQATLVHELTHVLQDQHFDLERLGQLPTDGENNAFLAVIEGDALRIEAEWAAQLGRQDREALMSERTETAGGVELGEDVPGALVALFSSPYVLGEPFVSVVLDEQAEEGINKALRTPPRTEEQLLDPYVYLAGDEPLTVGRPAVDEGDEVSEEGDFGALTWFLLLAEHLDSRQALRATDGWGGDSYVAFDRDDRACVRSAFRGDTPADTNEMATALEQWSSSVPANDASVSRRGDDVVLESCDPGTDGKADGGGGAEQALLYPVTRTYFTLGALQSGADQALARCIGTQFVLGLTTAELLDFSEVLADPQALADQSQRAAAACR